MRENPPQASAAFRPYPELVEARAATGDADAASPRPYRIFDSSDPRASGTGAVDLVERRMLVPLVDVGRATRIHELGHVRYSPRRPLEVDFDARVMAAVEDARVNHALAARGLPMELSAESELYVAWLLARDQQRGDGLAVWLRPIASIATSVEPRLRELLAPWRDGAGERVIEQMDWIGGALENARAGAGEAGETAEAAPVDCALELATELAHLLWAEGLLDEAGTSESRFELGCCKRVSPGDAGHGIGARRRGHLFLEEGDDEVVVAPGELVVTRVPLHTNRGAGLGRRTWRAATEGSVVRYTHRWPSDRAIFRKPARQARGCVLIDVSGSMRFEAADLDRLVASTAAGLRVAIYAGDGDKGELRVVADGRGRANEEHFRGLGNGNVVDLPALSWLARQRGPLFWVSDGGVTGVDDQASYELSERCAEVCTRARIRRVEDLEAVSVALGGAPTTAMPTDAS